METQKLLESLLNDVKSSFERELVRFVIDNHTNFEQGLVILQKIDRLTRATSGCASEKFCLAVKACYIESLSQQLESKRRDFFANPATLEDFERIHETMNTWSIALNNAADQKLITNSDFKRFKDSMKNFREAVALREFNTQSNTTKQDTIKSTTSATIKALVDPEMLTQYRHHNKQANNTQQRPSPSNPTETKHMGIPILKPKRPKPKTASF